MSQNCISPKFRVSFPNVFKAVGFGTQEPKYSIQMLFPKDVDLSVMKKAADAACAKKWGDDKKKWPKNLALPFRDGDEQRGDKAEYTGMTFVTASSKQRPQVIDAKKQPIIEEDQTFYAGCYARAQLFAYAWNYMGKNGVSFGLQNIQKLSDGPRFSGKKDASDVFDEYEEDTDLGFD